MGVKVAKGQQPKIADENIWCLKVIKLFHELRTTKGKTPIELDKKEYKDVWRTPTSKLLVKPEIGFELEHKDDTKGAVSNGVTLDPNDDVASHSLSF